MPLQHYCGRFFRVFEVDGLHRGILIVGVCRVAAALPGSLAKKGRGARCDRAVPHHAPPRRVSTLSADVVIMGAIVASHNSAGVRNALVRMH